MTTKTIALTQAQAQTQAQAPVNTTIVAISAAILAGAFMIFFAGFAEANVLHNATHDTRHAFAFPCH
jgi:cobalt transporter subunit CbtB